MKNIKTKILTDFTYEELNIIKERLKETDTELLEKINKLIDEGEKWF